jgi:hypothetical protein
MVHLVLLWNILLKDKLMSTYSPDVKIYYGPKDADHRLIPAPDVAISLELDYSNDTVIGYKYIITLTGIASGLDLRNVAYGGNIPEPSSYGIGAITNQIHILRKILSQNGNILHIVHGDTEDHILKAKGGILRSLRFDESSNNWTHFANYTATIEFTSLDLLNYTEDCSSLFLDGATYSANDTGITNIATYKIKSFTDSWKLSFDETEAFNRVKNIDTGYNLNINNSSFNIEYSISATGKHNHVYTDEETGESKLLPAWEQAKNFVQYRLYYQVINLLNGVLKLYDNACTSTDTLSTVNIPGTTAAGLYSGLNDLDYNIFNEQISCESSESDGTFSATYSAVVKSKFGNLNWSSVNTKHTVNKTVTRTSSQEDPNNVSISVNGSIEGLIPGGLIRAPKPLALPDGGAFLIFNGSTLSKYTYAKLLLDQIYSDNDYNGGIGDTGKRDLRPFFKNALGIVLPALNENCTIDPGVPEPADPPHPVSFNLTHDYNSGIITYDVEYNSNNLGGRKYRDVSIQITNPNKVIAVFNIPNSFACARTQELGTYTAKTVSVTVQGRDYSEMGQPTELNLVNEWMSGGWCIDEAYLPIALPMLNNAILTQKQYTKDPITGAFTVNLTYICDNPGCYIA